MYLLCMHCGSEGKFALYFQVSFFEIPLISICNWAVDKLIEANCYLLVNKPHLYCSFDADLSNLYLQLTL